MEEYVDLSCTPRTSASYMFWMILSRVMSQEKVNNKFRLYRKALELEFFLVR